MATSNRSNKSNTNNETKKTQNKLTTLKHTKFITATYHKLPQSFNCILDINKIYTSIINNITHNNVTYKFKSIHVSKEHYDLKKNPNNKGLCHLHVLIEFNKYIRIHNNLNIAKILSFNFDNSSYYPHASPCHNKKAYLDYITKLHGNIEEIQNCSNYCYYNITNDEIALQISLEDIHRNMGIMTKSQAREILSKHPLSNVMQNKQTVDFLFAKLPDIREKIDEFIIKRDALKYLATDYKNNKNYNTIKQLLYLLTDNTNKYSGYIHGLPNTGKTSMVCAAIAEMEDKTNKKYAVIKFNDLDSIKAINQLNTKQYDHIFILLDDIALSTEEEKHRTYILNLLSGNEMPTTLKCRYENAKFHQKMIKIFTNNVSFDEFIAIMREEYKVRVKEVKLNGDYVYLS